MLITKTYNQALKKRLRTNPEALKVNGDGVCAPRNQIVYGTGYRPIMPIGHILSLNWHYPQVPTGPKTPRAVRSGTRSGFVVNQITGKTYTRIALETGAKRKTVSLGHQGGLASNQDDERLLTMSSCINQAVKEDEQMCIARWGVPSV